MTKEIKKYSEKEYKSHGDMMYEIGKQEAFKSILKTKVSWSVKMPDENWDLDTIVVGNGSLKDISFYKEVLTEDLDDKGSYIREFVKSTAKNGTVKEIWLAADRAYKEAVKLYGDWHYFLEEIELKGRKNKAIFSFYGS